jgi:hypothetical protein
VAALAMCRTALVYNKALTFSVDCIRGVAIANDKLMDQARGESLRCFWCSSRHEEL